MEQSVMPRQRLPENQGFPKRWRRARNAIYYQVPPGLEYLWDGKQTFKLGNTEAEAYKTWASRIEDDGKNKTISEALDRYLLEVIPLKAPRTQKDNRKQAERLRTVFGHMSPLELKPQDIYVYYDKREGKVAARREIALLSHLMTKAVEWGYIDKHPFKGEVRLEGEKPRTRYVSDKELVECLSLPNVRLKGSVLAVQAYIRLKLLTGLRRADLLRMRVSQCKNDGIHVKTSKTGKFVIYSWTPELRHAVDCALSVRPVDISPHLFCTKRGQSYIKEDGSASGWDSMWQRFMKRILKETKVTERFTEHDLRAKCASDAETLEHARQLLAHADSNITQRVYRRAPERVRPLR